MTKLHKTATALLLTAALFMTGCSGKTPESDTSANGSSDVSFDVSGGNSSDPSDVDSSDISGGSQTDPDTSDTLSGSQTDPDTSDSPSGSDNGSEPITASEITAKFEVPDGGPVDLTNAVVDGRGVEIPLSEITRDNWTYIMCDYVYLAKPLGIYYNSVDNADIFNKDELKFEGAPEKVTYEYKKYKVGDMFGSLKLVEASTTFSSDLPHIHPAYFNGGRVSFEGELTLTGKCCIAPETEGYTTARDIYFYPDASGAELPIMSYMMDENGSEELGVGMSGDFCWLSDSPGLVLGNADNYPNFDFGDFPDDGSCVDVQVTIDDIDFCNEIMSRRGYFAHLVDFKVIQ